MAKVDTGLSEALTRVTEQFGRLLTQHLQLARAELESEGRRVASRAKAGAQVTLRAVPFVLAGLVLASLGAAACLALVLEAWLGRASMATSLVLVGLVETAGALAWLKRGLQRAAQGSEPSGPSEPEREMTALARTSAQGRKDDTQQTAPVRGTTRLEGGSHGAVG